MFAMLENLRTVDPSTYDYLQQFAFLGTMAMVARLDRKVSRLVRRIVGTEKKIRKLTPPVGTSTRAASQPGV